VKLPKIKTRYCVVHIPSNDKKLVKEGDTIVTTVYDLTTQKPLKQLEIGVATGATKSMSVLLYRGHDDDCWSIKELNRTLLGVRATSIDQKLQVEFGLPPPKQLVIRLLKATDLAPMKNNTADPYCHLYFNTKKSTKVKSKVANKTLNPDWNQVIVLPIPKEEFTDFIIEVWDYQTSKFLGTVCIPLNHLQIQRKLIYKLSKRSGGSNFLADSHVKGSLEFYVDVETQKPMIEMDTKIFGVELLDVMKRKDETGKIPQQLKFLFDIVSKSGPPLEGIFRVPGKSEAIEEMCMILDDGGLFPIESKDIEWVHAVASTIKQYLRALPNPLLTYDLYEAFLKAGDLKDNAEVQAELAKLVSKLPVPYRALLFEILLLSKDIEAHAEINKMTAENLAIVLGVNLLRYKEINPLKQVTDMQRVQKTLTYMINLFPNYFMNNNNAM